MTEKTPPWADWLLTLWVVTVAVFYFGGYFFPAQIGRYTAAASALYAAMLLVSAGVLALRYLSREKASGPPKVEEQKKPKKRK